MSSANKSQHIKAPKPVDFSNPFDALDEAGSKKSHTKPVSAVSSSPKTTVPKEKDIVAVTASTEKLSVDEKSPTTTSPVAKNERPSTKRQNMDYRLPREIFQKIGSTDANALNKFYEDVCDRVLANDDLSEEAALEQFVKMFSRPLSKNGFAAEAAGVNYSVWPSTHPLMHAVAQAGRHLILDYLIKNGHLKEINFISAKSDARITALHLAAYYGYPEAVRVLLDAGADKKILSHYRETPLDSVVMHGCQILGDAKPSELGPVGEKFINNLSLVADVLLSPKPFLEMVHEKESKRSRLSVFSPIDRPGTFTPVDLSPIANACMYVPRHTVDHAHSGLGMSRNLHGDVRLGGVPFHIAPAGNNFWTPIDDQSADGTTHTEVTATLDCNVSSPLRVFTLINCMCGSPDAGLASVHFTSASGETASFDLVSGQNIRDFNQSGFENATTDTNVREVLSLSRGRGHSTRADMQTWELPESFRSSSLVKITITDKGAAKVQRLICLGVTVQHGEDTPLPEHYHHVPAPATPAEKPAEHTSPAPATARPTSAAPQHGKLHGHPHPHPQPAASGEKKGWATLGKPSEPAKAPATGSSPQPAGSATAPAPAPAKKVWGAVPPVTAEPIGTKQPSQPKPVPARPIIAPTPNNSPAVSIPMPATATTSAPKKSAWGAPAAAASAPQPKPTTPAPAGPAKNEWSTVVKKGK